MLPQQLILKPHEIEATQTMICELDRMLSLNETTVIRGRELANSEAVSVMIAALLLKGGGQRLDRESAAALTEDYLDAIEDVPAWAVREALRKWNRAESVPLDGQPHDFNFRPAPPTLRRLALVETGAVQGRKNHLERICAAVPLLEFSEEHRKKMKANFDDLLMTLATGMEAKR